MERLVAQKKLLIELSAQLSAYFDKLWKALTGLAVVVDDFMGLREESDPQAGQQP